jgi:DtxR family manganese transport transcriptional regulator
MTNRFQRTRQDHRQEIAEDYVELIEALTLETGEARTSDIAARLGITPVTVSKTVRRLQREGLVQFQPYRSIFLTEAGKAMAARTRERHEIVHRFLLSLGISPETAEADTEGIEHHVSDETLAAMAAAVRA